MSTKVRFRAVVALLGIDTFDGRCLLPAPEGIPLMRELPLPAMATQTTAGSLHRSHVQIGCVDDMYTEDDGTSLVMVGFFFEDHASQAFARLLAQGKRWFELDCDGVRDQDIYVLEDENGDTRTVFRRWRAIGITAGERPCWDLPPVDVLFP